MDKIIYLTRQELLEFCLIMIGIGCLLAYILFGKIDSNEPDSTQTD